MTIPIRIEKLKFLVDEMQLALYLAEHAPDPFVARTLTRPILIRAQNFIEHGRQLSRPLRTAGYDARDFKEAVNIYARNFDEYFSVSRHKLGAHMQDFDFGKRIELWTDIEAVKVGYFVEGAIEIYRKFAQVGLPSYVPHVDPVEMSDSTLKELLLQFQRQGNDRRWVEFGVDPLAITRPNTAVALNLTPVHARAGQAVLVRLWINMQLPLIDRLKSFPRIVRLLKARVVTDIVSYCDCIVTRTVPAGAPQEMDGLDRLIAAEGQSAAPINDFVVASNFVSELQGSRTVRDTVGGHLEIDASVSLSSILADLDAFDLDRAQGFFTLLDAAFAKTCRNILYLRMYARDGVRAYGIATSSSSSVAPFSGDKAEPLGPPPAPPLNDEDAYQRNLALWLDGDEDQRGDGRQFFWNAFMGSECVEEIEEIDDRGGFVHRSIQEYRKAHQFIEATLKTGISDTDFSGILELLLTCSRGWPYPLAELLVRCGEIETPSREYQICYALGEIGSTPHARVERFFEKLSKHLLWGLRYQAAIARFKTVIRSEGVFRANHRGQSRLVFADFTHSLVSSMTAPESLLCTLSFASIISSARLGVPFQAFESDYATLQLEIERQSLPWLRNDEGRHAKVTILSQLVKTHDYVGVALVLAMDLIEAGKKNVGNALIDSCCNGSIVTALHDQASRHLAMCFYQVKDYVRALEVAEGIASRNPETIDAQILVAQILTESPHQEDRALRMIERIRTSYKVAAEKEVILAGLEREIAQRPRDAVM